MGSTQGYGYQPLVSAGMTAVVSSAGTISQIAIGNSGDQSLYSTAKRFADDPSPLISETARRACELLDKKVS